MRQLGVLAVVCCRWKWVHMGLAGFPPVVVQCWGWQRLLGGLVHWMVCGGVCSSPVSAWVWCGVDALNATSQASIVPQDGWVCQWTVQPVVLLGSVRGVQGLPG